MIKKSLFVIIVALLLLFPASFMHAAAASSDTASAAAASASAIDDSSLKAQELLDRIATKVAQLTSKLRRTYSGTVTSIGTTSYIVTTTGGDKTVTTNDVTSFYRLRSGNRSDTGFTGIKSGDYITALGNVDPQTGEMTARQIIAKIARRNIVGKIASASGSIITLSPSDESPIDIDLSDGIEFIKVAADGTFAKAKIADFRPGSVAFVIAYRVGQATVLSTLKAMIVSADWTN